MISDALGLINLQMTSWRWSWHKVENAAEGKCTAKLLKHTISAAAANIDSNCWWLSTCINGSEASRASSVRACVSDGCECAYGVSTRSFAARRHRMNQETLRTVLDYYPRPLIFTFIVFPKFFSSASHFGDTRFTRFIHPTIILLTLFSLFFFFSPNF